MIELENVRRAFGKKTAVAGISLTIRSGELFTLLGRNGAGKTTTLKMLVGLLKPESGSIRIGNIDVQKHTVDSNRLIGYVPDEPRLYDKLTGREFLQFICEMYGLSTADIPATIDKHIEIFQLSDFVDNLAESYSHGMKQRTVFAAALVHNPSVLIIDEPMVGLDPHSSKIVKDHLKHLAKQGAAILLSTHTLSLAENIADRIGIMNAGRLLFDGTLEELRKQSTDSTASLEQLYLEMVQQAEEHSTNGK